MAAGRSGQEQWYRFRRHSLFGLALACDPLITRFSSEPLKATLISWVSAPLPLVLISSACALRSRFAEVVVARAMILPFFTIDSSPVLSSNFRSYTPCLTSVPLIFVSVGKLTDSVLPFAKTERLAREVTRRANAIRFKIVFISGLLGIFCRPLLGEHAYTTKVCSVSSKTKFGKRIRDLTGSEDIQFSGSLVFQPIARHVTP